MVKTKTPPVEIKIIGSQQTDQINKAFEAKKIADEASNTYSGLRTAVLDLIKSKVFAFWTKVNEPKVGAYNLNLADGEVRSVNVSNIGSKKVYDPKRAKEILAALNIGLNEEEALKAADVFTININHFINPLAMNTKGVREEILKVLIALEAKLKKAGTLAPEFQVIIETKTLMLAPHAVPRILAVTNDFPAAMTTLDNPISIAMVERKEDEN